MKNGRNLGTAAFARNIAGIFLAMMIYLPCLSISAQEAEMKVDGKALFLKNCSACHQIDGRGVPDAFPALVANPFLQGNVDDVASLLLTGRNGMPNFSKRLTDRDLAAIVSYVRGAWGNQGSGITADRVTGLRSALHAEVFDPAPQNMRH
jgi:cytochrome c6